MEQLFSSDNANEDVLAMLDEGPEFNYHYLVKEGKTSTTDVVHYIVNDDCKADLNDASIPYIWRFIRLFVDECIAEEKRIEKRHPYSVEPQQPDYSLLNEHDRKAEESRYKELVRNYQADVKSTNVKRSKTNYVEDILYELLIQHLRFNTARSDIEWIDGSPINWDTLIDLYIKSVIKNRNAPFSYKVSAPTSSRRHSLTDVQVNNQFYPAQDWASKLKWDGTDRLHQLAQVLGQDYDSTMWQLVLEWFKGSMNRFLHPGCKHEIVLILYGSQGKLKSTFLYELAFSFGELQTINTKDDLLQCHRNSLIEIGEVNGLFNRTQNEAMKEFISRRTDIIRPSYGKKALDLPRAFTLAATTNTKTFLNDATGSRRYVTITIDKDIDTLWVRANRDQIWAQIKEDESLQLCGYIPNYLMEKHAEENKQYQYLDSETEAILNFIDLLSEEDKINGVIGNDVLSEYEIPVQNVYLQQWKTSEEFLLNPLNVAIIVFNHNSTYSKVVDKTLANKINRCFVERCGFDYKNKKRDGQVKKVFTINI